MVLLQDNTPIHAAQAAVAEEDNCGSELLLYSPYSPDLAPSNFFLLPKIKSYLQGCYFGNNDEAICAVEDKDANFCDGMAMLEHH